MDPRFILHPTHVVDRSSARFLPPGTSFAGGHSPALLPSHLSPVQPFYTAYDQTLGVGEVAFSASVPSGQAYFRTDRLPPGTTVLQEVPNPEVGGVGYGLGPVNLGYRNVALTSLNNLQVAEIGPSAGVHSLIVPSYADVSGCGHGYGNTALVCVYQAYPQAQIHAGPALLPLSPLPSRQHMFLDQALDQEYGSLDQINPPLRARRMEVVRIRKLERGRVLDQRRELQRKPDIQKAFLKKKAFLEKGVHASSPKGNTWCSICKVECQSAHVLQNHIEGKKHKLKLEAAKEIQGSLKKKSEDVIKEAVKSSKEKEVEVSSLAAKQQEGKAEKDGIADEAINKALLEIGKVGADFTVDRVYNELKTGDLDAEKPFKVVIKEAVKSSKEKEVEVDSNHQQAVKTAKTEKARRKRLRRAQQRRSLAAKQQEGKAEKDGIADEAINKALLEIGKVGADLTVDRVYNELKTGDLDAEKPFKVVIKEAVKSSKEKKVEVDSNHQQTVKTAKTEKARRKRLRRAEAEEGSTTEVLSCQTTRREGRKGWNCR
ncbi:hypothetical protein O6H91_18G030300 [Diphasiastrum complanatum]|uniref:Uncharacterized protein n=1 Tax=Diphasiastrum complanatum TaxID=34168 RepID=A0ACC2B0D8_DIPCM|nr:hypothetical protein O6H91_18G030300 [Diphasiastrum complanatum]